MKLVSVDSLKEKDIVAQPVMTGDYKILLKKGTVLKKDYIEKLKEIRIEEVYIEDGFLEEKNFLVDKELFKEALGEVKKDYVGHVRDVLGRYIYGKEEKLSQLKSDINELLDNVLSKPQVMEKVYEIKERSSDMYEHTLNVSFLSMALALKLQLDRDMVRKIGTAAMLHDIGLRYITVSYENKEQEEMSKRDREEYKKHTIYGYSGIKDVDWLTDDEKNMILQHHENLMGTGYPFHKKDIGEPAQILAVCELLDEMTCGIGHKRKKIKEIMEVFEKMKGVCFSSRIIDMLGKTIVLYPTGSSVVLNDGTTGVVIEQNVQDLKKPVLRVTKVGHILKNLRKEASDLQDEAAQPEERMPDSGEKAAQPEEKMPDSGKRPPEIFDLSKNEEFFILHEI